jgi:exodeoxyribonuclease V alpha subunit
MTEAYDELSFTEIDAHFARLMAKLNGAPAPELELAASLVSQATGSGNVCLDLSACAGRVHASRPGEPLPEREAWVEALRRCPVVGEPGEFRPLVLDASHRLYLYRYWDYERRLADELARRAAAATEVDEARLAAGLARLFPAPADDTDWQKVAAAAAVLRGLCVISGGPGTGKTTTVVKILALLLEQVVGAARAPAIALAAPTGKAAARLQEAVRVAKQELDVSTSVRTAIPEEAATLHRLLGARPGSAYFRHDSRHPLPFDVLVVDEASMVDQALMTKLVSALAPRARLILLGDKDQLASVEAGAVLADICGSAPGYSASFAARLARVSGERIPPTAAAPGPLADSIVSLTRSYRFGARSQIGRLAQLVRAGDGEAALRLLEESAGVDILWRTFGDGDLHAGSALLATRFAPYFEAVHAQADVAALHAALNRQRLLCAHRTGPFGAEQLNRLIEQALRARHLADTRRTWYAGRPVMVSRNDYALRVYNGDVGITLGEPGAASVAFVLPDAAVRRLAPARLPEHQTVYAMTVHKAQGSEFDEVVLVLPPQVSPVLTRELVYTAITRARRRIEIWGTPDVFLAAVARRSERASGLRDRLWARSDDGAG